MLLAHGVALLSLFQSGLQACSVLLAASLVYYLRQYYFRLAIKSLQLQGANCLVAYADGTVAEVLLGRNHFISNALVVMQVRRPRRRTSQALVLFGDAMNAEHFRRLRVQLRFPETDDRGSSSVPE